MRFFIALFLVLFAAVLVILGLGIDSGYVLIRLAGTSIETSVAVLVAVLVLGFFALYFLLRLVSGAQRVPSKIRESAKLGRSRRARQSLVQGLIELSEGQWAQAEKSLEKNAEGSDTPLLHYLGAARAAQLQRAPDRRDNYLRKAHEAQPDAELAIGLAQAELQLLHGQLPQALATLTHLRELAPKHNYVLKLLVVCHRQLEDWDALAELWPQVQKQRVFDEEYFRDIGLEIHQQRLQEISKDGDREALKQAWEQVPLELWEDVRVLRAYATTLHAHKLDGVAADVIRQALKREWDDELVLLYGKLDVASDKKQLATVETWIKKYGNRPSLLLTAGRVCAANELWGKARSYLQESAELAPSAEAWQELGQLLEQLGEQQAALEAYRKAANLQGGDTLLQAKAAALPKPATPGEETNPELLLTTDRQAQAAASAAKPVDAN